MFEGQFLLRMGSKSKSPTLAKQVGSLVNFKGGHEMFMFDPKEQESLQKVRDRYYEKKLKFSSTDFNSGASTNSELNEAEQ